MMINVKFCIRGHAYWPMMTPVTAQKLQFFVQVFFSLAEHFGM